MGGGSHLECYSPRGTKSFKSRVETKSWKTEGVSHSVKGGAEADCKKDEYVITSQWICESVKSSGTHWNLD